MILNNAIIKLNHSTVQLREDDIVEVHFLKNSMIDVKECEELIAVYDQLLENKKYLLLHLTDEYVTFTSEARKFFSFRKRIAVF